MTNQKYEITGIAHEKYPFLHRIRALRDIGDKVKAGDLGGFVEREENLSFEPGDDAWIFDDAIAAGEGCVDKVPRLFGDAIVCGNAYLTQNGSMSAHARAEGDAYIRGAALCGHARACGASTILNPAGKTDLPILSEHCTVYGTVQGNVHIMGTTVILAGEIIRHNDPDALTVKDTARSIVRDPIRDELKPYQPQEKEKKRARDRGRDR